MEVVDMNRSMIVLWAFILIVSPASAAELESELNTENGLALHGYDPVSYHLGEPIEGKQEISISYEGVTYQFATRDHLVRFKQRPESYLPAYGGWCAWAMLEGEKVDVDPETYKIIDGKTYLFYNTFFANTLKKWNVRAAKEGDASLVSQADSAWNTAAERK